MYMYRMLYVKGFFSGATQTKNFLAKRVVHKVIKLYSTVVDVLFLLPHSFVPVLSNITHTVNE